MGPCLHLIKETSVKPLELLRINCVLDASEGENLALARIADETQ